MSALNDVIELKSGEKFRAIDLVTEIELKLIESEEEDEIIFLLNKVKACDEFTDKNKLEIRNLLFLFLFENTDWNSTVENETFSKLINYDFSLIYRRAVDYLKYRLFIMCCGISICSIKPTDELKCKTIIVDKKIIHSIGGIFFSPKKPLMSIWC